MYVTFDKGYMCTWSSACYTTLFFTFPGYDVTILSPIVSKDWYCDLCFCGSFTLFTGTAIVVSEWFLLVVMWMPLSDECKNSLLKMKCNNVANWKFFRIKVLCHSIYFQSKNTCRNFFFHITVKLVLIQTQIERNLWYSEVIF